jgi:hypothetical protein
MKEMGERRNAALRLDKILQLLEAVLSGAMAGRTYA